MTEIFIALMLIALCVHVLVKEQTRIARFQKAIQPVQHTTQSGFSLSELLVALALSMILLVTLMQVLTSVGHQYYKTHHAIQETLELQWFYELLNRRVYHAGFTPCVRLDHLVRVDTRQQDHHLSSIEVSSHKDKLIVQGMSESAFSLGHVLTPYTIFAKSITLKKERPIMIADCTHAEVHTLSASKARKNGVTLYLKEPLVFDYGTEMYVGEWLSETFYFKKKAIYYRRHRSDYVLSAEKAWFELKNKRLTLSVTSLLGKTFTLYAESKMP